MPMTLYFLIGIAAFLLAGFAVSYIIVNTVFFSKFYKGVSSEKLERIGLQPDYYKQCLKEIEKSRARMESLPCKRVYCKVADGIRLSARYYDNRSDVTVVLFHGANAIPWNNFGYIGERLFDRGFNILVTDMRAHGQSDGKYITYGNMECKDVLQWLDFLKEEQNTKSIILYGISMGASAVCYASDEIHDDRVKLMIVDCGFTSPYELEKHLLHSSGVSMWIMGFCYLAGNVIVKAKPKEQTTDHLKNSKIPALFIHGKDDVVVPLSQGERNYEACAANKDMIIVENAGHTVATVVGGDTVCLKILEFIDKYK